MRHTPKINLYTIYIEYEYIQISNNKISTNTK